MKIGICDDNKIYLNYLVETLHKHLNQTKNVTIDALCPDKLSVQLKAGSFPYDIIITDIAMGEFNGIDLAKEINRINSTCIIIFISGYINLATEVYDAKHIYFVLKSEAECRLPKALEKAFAAYNERLNQCLSFRFQNVEYVIPLMNITHIEAYGRYLYIHDIHQTYKCISSLKLISSDLPYEYQRCHNSYIINFNHIRSISRTNCVLTSGIEIPISQGYSKCFQSAYVKFISRKLT